MAGITIIQQPSTTNVAYTKLLYVASSSRIDQPQFKYVADLYISGSDNMLGRFKTVPNEQSVGVLDFSVPIQGQLGYDAIWKAIPLSSSIQLGKEFIVKFGEEYGISPSSSVTVYNGLPGNIVGDPAVESSASFVFKGINDPVVSNSYNFDSTTFDTGSFTQKNLGVTASYAQLRGPRLSNYPRGYQEFITEPKPISSNDWETISFLKKNDSGYDYSTSNIVVYQSGSSTAATETLYTNTDFAFPEILTLGVGPQNFLSSSNATLAGLFSGNWNHYQINNVYKKGADILSSSYWYVNDDVCAFETTSSFTDVFSTGAWTTKNNIPTGQKNTQGAGTTTAAWSAGGLSGSATAVRTDEFFLWDGTNWSTSDVLPAKRSGCANVGTQTKSFVVGGVLAAGTTLTTLLYDGAAWSSQASLLGSVRTEMGAVGNYGAARVSGGGVGGGESKSEIWNGTSWAFGPNLAAVFRSGATAGSVNSFILSARSSDGYNQQFDGTSYSTIANNSVSSGNKAGSGTSNSSAMIYGGDTGGSTALNLTEGWNGNTWTTLANLNTSRNFNMGAGNNVSALTWGGNRIVLGSATDILSTEEFAGAVTPVENNDSFYFINDSNKNNYETTRFAFINQYGTWDYYSVSTPIKKLTKLTRQNVILSQVNYSAYTPVYDISKRSNTQYYVQLEDMIEITTEYIDQDVSNWLTELFESPSVFEQLYIEETNSYEFVPIVIDNNAYTWDTDSREHVFQYTIKYRRANQRRSRI